MKAHSRQKVNSRYNSSHLKAKTNLSVGGASKMNNASLNVGNAIGTIEKLLKLLSDHCKVCPQFAEEFEKLHL